MKLARFQRSDLRGYQLALGSLVKSLKKVLLAVDMGLGKTVTCLTVFADLLASGSLDKLLVVAPKRVAELTWAEEVGMWEHLQGLRVSVVAGTPKQREKALAKPADVYLLGRDNFSWLCLFFKGRLPFRAVVWDESSSLKDGKKKTKSGAVSRFGWLLKVAPALEYLVLLSGTPAPEGVEGLWGQIRVLDGGAALGKFKTHFFEKWYINRGRDFPDWVIRKGAYEEIMAAAAPLMAAIRTEDVLTLPPRVDVDTWIDLPADALKTYRTLKKDFVALLTSGAEVSAQSAATLLSKLAQCSSGAVYDEARTVHHVHDAKLDALEDLVEQGENLLVFYQYKHDLERIRARFPFARNLRDDPTAIADWNAGKVRMLVAHPASAGHGLNLQHGGRVVVWFSLPWSLEQYQQACKRLHRSGQKGASVSVVHLLCRRTVDSQILNALRQKTVASAAMIEQIAEPFLANVCNQIAAEDLDELLPDPLPNPPMKRL